MKVLVTGGAGFIGSHIVDRHIAMGDEVIVVDDLSTGKMENLNPAAKFYELDIRDDATAELILDEEPDVINHQAAQIQVTVSLKRPDFDADVNILGGLKLLEAARKVPINKFIFASTGGAIYGDPDPSLLPANEELPAAPISHYGTGKLAFEKYLHVYAETYGINYTALRYSNVFGPRQDPHGEAGVTAIFALRMLADEEIVMFGDGTETRDYTYISDIAEANILGLEKGDREILCIGRSVEVTVPEIFDRIAAITGYKKEPVRKPLRPGEVHRIYLDNSKAKRILGWEPKVNFDEGLEETVEFFRKKVK
ncbi:MAG: NAD-dependent epimerase/dehydratase family protein [bacterium]|nr:NAD-dependent epimerase/dehydratase family protein [bacterium]